MGLASRYIIEVQETLRLLMKQPVDREMLHRFRVQVKKMKAIWVIHPIGNDIDFKRSFPTIGKLYKLAASVRDKQLILSSLESLPSFAEYPALKKTLKAGIKKHKKKFVEKLKIRHTRYRVYEEKRIFAAYFKVASAGLLRHNRKEFKHLTFLKLMEETGKDPAVLHELRRYCKYLLFQCSAFHVSATGKGNEQIIEALNHIQHSIGNWHDWWNTSEWLKKPEGEEKKLPALQSLRKQVNKKEEFIRREVLGEIQTLLHHFHLQTA